MIPGWRKVSEIARERGLSKWQADALVDTLRAVADKFPGLVQQFKPRGCWYVNEDVAKKAGFGRLLR